jgi:hypothetical protein
MMSVLRLHTIDDRKINEYGAIVICELAGGTEKMRENLPHHIT